MALVKLIEYEDASPEVRAVYDDIMTSRKVDWINNFWKALASDPRDPQAHLGKRQGSDGAGRPRSADQGAHLYRRQRHQQLRLLHQQPHRLGAQGRHDRRPVRRAASPSSGMANETNRLVNGYQVEIDERIAKAAKQR